MKIRGLRWWIAAMLFAAAVLNYVDRQTLSLLAPTIQRDLRMDDAQYAWVVNAFLVAYIAANTFSGPLVDRLGTRVAYAIFIGWWSVANVLTGFVRSAGTMAGVRALLGLGEAGNWIASPKAVAEWFPARERGLAIGLYTMGATVGATVAPIMIVLWAADMAGPPRSLLPGCWACSGCCLGCGFTVLHSITRESPSPNDPCCKIWMNRTLTMYKIYPRGRGGKRWATGGSRALVVGRLLTDPVWYFYQFWFAKYLFGVRHLEQKDLTITWIVFLAADLGSLVGGWLSGRLIRRGINPAAGRMRVMLFCALLMPVAPLVALVPSLNVVLMVAVVVVSPTWPGSLT